MIDACNMQLMGPILAAHGFHFSKAKGQNFLVAGWVPEQIAVQSGVDASTGVLEIGPGVGSLTQQLCQRAGKVCAVEVDGRLKPILQETVGGFSNLEILWDDVLKLDVAELVRERMPGLRPAACANLPYYITSPILTALLQAECFDTITVMVQKEVAQRIVAKPGTADYSAFSILCQYYAQPELLFEVPPDCFVPRPKVMSAVVTLHIRRELPWNMDDPALFFRVVRASFAQRRKSLQNGLASGFPALGKAGAGEVLEQCGLTPSIRGETLDIPTFASIAAEIGRRQKK